MAPRIFITGATGNVGQAVLAHLVSLAPTYQVVAGVRHPEQARRAAQALPTVSWVAFDFERPETFGPALAGVDRLFLLRPPQLADAKGTFGPLLQAMQHAGVQQVMFLSVQGVERSSVIPHHQIERLIEQAGLAYIFLRPSYFMQNLSTTLGEDLRQRREIVLPAGKARFNWVDVDNIGEVAAHLLLDFEAHQGQKPDITGYETMDFHAVVEQLNQVLTHPVRYRPVNPLHFWWIKRRAGLPHSFILVMLMLHFLPRFQSDPPLSTVYEQLTGKKPTPLLAFLAREKDQLQAS
jgi:uncharacterized protein YbjT (DUF2867 family)